MSSAAAELLIIPQAALPASIGSSYTGVAAVLTTLEQFIFVLALLVLVWTVVGWSRRRRRDPLHNAPLRSNHLGVEPILIAVFVYMLAAVVTSSVVGLIIDDPNGVRGRLITGISAQLCGIAACLLIADRCFGGGWTGFVFGHAPGRWGRRVTLIFCASILALGLCPLIGEVTVRVILYLFPSHSIEPHPTIAALRAGSQPAWVVATLWIGAVIVAPIGEEFFFRGLLQTFMVGIVRNRWVAIALTAVVFGMVHISQPHTVVALAALGVLLGYSYERTGSLVPSILIHSVFNLKTLIWDALDGVKP